MMDEELFRKVESLTLACLRAAFKKIDAEFGIKPEPVPEPMPVEPAAEAAPLRVPEDWVDRQTSGKTFTLFGIPNCDLTREELYAAVLTREVFRIDVPTLLPIELSLLMQCVRYHRGFSVHPAGVFTTKHSELAASLYAKYLRPGGVD